MSDSIEELSSEEFQERLDFIDGKRNQLSTAKEREFICWFPEITNLIFKNFKIFRIQITIEDLKDGRLKTFSYNKGGNE